jgi:hypothetical protein
MTMDMTKRLESLLDRYRTGGIDRRTFLSLTAAAAATVGVTAGWSRKALAASAKSASTAGAAWCKTRCIRARSNPIRRRPA